MGEHSSGVSGAAPNTGELKHCNDASPHNSRSQDQRRGEERDADNRMDVKEFYTH